VSKRRFVVRNLFWCGAALLLMGGPCGAPSTNNPPDGGDDGNGGPKAPPPPVVTSCGLLGNNCNPPAGQQPSAIELLDLDRDNDLDIVVANAGADTLWVIRNDGNGKFTHIQTLGGGDMPSAMAAGDFDRDGLRDLAVCSLIDGIGITISTLFNDGDTTFTVGDSYPIGGVATFATAADLDGDNDLDLITVNEYTNTISLLPNEKGVFGEAMNLATGRRPRAVVAADLDGDGDVDLAVVNSGDNTVGIYRNGGVANFLPAILFTVGTKPTGITALDVDGDGDMDLAVANEGTGDGSAGVISLLLNNGNAHFGTPRSLTTGVSPSAIVSADFNGDGLPDLATANFGIDAQTSTVGVLLNNGAGGFHDVTAFLTPAGPYRLAVGDVDRDGDLDIVTANFNANSLTLLLNDGTGSFGGAE
jgi:hypothetical protein